MVCQMVTGMKGFLGRMEEAIDYKTIVESLQAENECLREQLAKLKLFPFNGKIIEYFVMDMLQSPYYFVGYCIGILTIAMLWLARSMIERKK